jgi:hypothetical protein
MEWEVWLLRRALLPLRHCWRGVRHCWRGVALLWHLEERITLSWWWRRGLLYSWRSGSWQLLYWLYNLHLLYWLYNLPVRLGSSLCHCLLVKHLHHLLCCLHHLLSWLHCSPCSWDHDSFDRNQLLTLIGLELVMLNVLLFDVSCRRVVQILSLVVHPVSPSHRLRCRWKTWLGSCLDNYWKVARVWG